MCYRHGGGDGHSGGDGGRGCLCRRSRSAPHFPQPVGAPDGWSACSSTQQPWWARGQQVPQALPREGHPSRTQAWERTWTGGARNDLVSGGQRRSPSRGREGLYVLKNLSALARMIALGKTCMFSLPNLPHNPLVRTVQAGEVAPAFDGAIPSGSSPSAPSSTAPTPSAPSSTDSSGGENGGGPDEDTPQGPDAMDVSEAPEANPASPTTGKL